MSQESYILERTRNRSSRAILKDGTVIIKLAGRLSRAEEQRHIETLLRRIVKAKARDAARETIDPFRPLLSGSEILTLQPIVGSPLHLHVIGGRGLSAKEKEGVWIVRKHQESEKRSFHRLLWRAAAIHASDALTEFVHMVNKETFGFGIRSVELKFMRSRWGSCSLGGKISLSTPLLFTDLQTLRYVVIHELAHIRHPDHSASFWKTVASADPDFESSVSRLKGLRLPVL